MHYYQFNIGDYASHTQRLTPLEDLAYRRMLDYCYLHERPLNGCSTEVARDIGLMDHLDAVDYVLSKFFELTDDGYINHRVEFEIEQYRKKLENASKAGKASAKARKIKNQDKVNGRSTGVEQPCNQTLTNNHKPITINNTHTLDNIYLSTQMAEFALQVWLDNNAILDVDAEWQRFVDYHKATGKHYDNWEAAWQFWVADDKTLSRGI